MFYIYIYIFICFILLLSIHKLGELEHDNEKKNAKPLQFAYLFYHFNENQLSRNDSKIRYAKLAIYDFQIIYIYIYII